jgi:hypothetical protein
MRAIAPTINVALLLAAGLAVVIASSSGCAIVDMFFNLSEAQHEAIDRGNPSSERTRFEAYELHSEVDRIYN